MRLCARCGPQAESVKVTPMAPSQVQTLATSAYSENTRRCYDAQYRQFVQWCEEKGKWRELAPAYPTEAVCEYLQARAERGICSSTLLTIRAAIAAHTREAGLPDPTRHDSVRRLLHGAKQLRAGDRRPATGLTRQHMRKIAPIATPKQWALLCLMRDCLLRRSEAAAARWRDLECEPDGTTGHFTVPYSKNGPERPWIRLVRDQENDGLPSGDPPEATRPGSADFRLEPALD